MNRKEHWEAIYKSKSPVEVSWYQQKPTISLELIAKCSLSTSDSIIDVGGGASTLCDYLLESGYNHLTVLDLSANALEHSKQRLGNKASSIEWQVEDVMKFSTPKHYDIWHDRAVFHFLTDESDRKKIYSRVKCFSQSRWTHNYCCFCYWRPYDVQWVKHRSIR